MSVAKSGRGATSGNAVNRDFLSLGYSLFLRFVLRICLVLCRHLTPGTPHGGANRGEFVLARRSVCLLNQSAP